MVRTYGVAGGLENTGWLIHQLGKEAVIGAWIDGTRDQPPPTGDPGPALPRGDVDVAVIGSEVLLREDHRRGSDGGVVEARRMIPKEIPTADTRRSFLDHPELLPLIDLVYVNHIRTGTGSPSTRPFRRSLHGTTPCVSTPRQARRGLRGRVSSDGDAVGDAIANPENAARFFLEFVSWARLNDVRYTYFSPLDEPWKEKYEGPGAHWGYRDGRCAQAGHAGGLRRYRDRHR